MIYTVEVRVEKSAISDFLSWIEPHVARVLETGCFQTATIERNVSPSDGAMFIIRYSFESLGDLERYESEHAEVLRNEGLTRFGTGLHITRSVYETLSNLTVSTMTGGNS